jgi:hypothetical protein
VDLNQRGGPCRLISPDLIDEIALDRDNGEVLGSQERADGDCGEVTQVARSGGGEQAEQPGG